MDNKKHPNPDWLKGKGVEQVSLTEELRCFARHMKLNETEIAARQLILKEVGKCVRSVYPDAEVNKFGSFANNLSIFCSDLDLSVDKAVGPTLPCVTVISRADTEQDMISGELDLSVSNLDFSERSKGKLNNLVRILDATAEATKEKEEEKNEESEPKPKQNETKKGGKKATAAGLKPLVAPLRKDRLVRSLLFISTARVPIIKIAYKCGVEADITYNNVNSIGFTALKCMLDCHGAALADLSVFLKVYLHQLGLESAGDHGLGSFKMYVMLSAYIERNPDFVKDRTNPDLGGLLLSFLKFYSRAANYQPISVSGADPVNLTKLSDKLVRKLCAAFSKAREVLSQTPKSNKPSVKADTTATATAAAGDNNNVSATTAETPAAPASIPGDDSPHSYLAKVINVAALLKHRESSHKDCAAFLNMATNKGNNHKHIHRISKHLDSPQRNNKTNNSQNKTPNDTRKPAAGKTNPVVASKPVGVARAYSVSSHVHNSVFGSKLSVPALPVVLPARSVVPFAGLRIKYQPGPVHNSFVYKVGSVFRRLYQMNVLR